MLGVPSSLLGNLLLDRGDLGRPVSSELRESMATRMWARQGRAMAMVTQSQQAVFLVGGEGGQRENEG